MNRKHKVQIFAIIYLCFAVVIPVWWAVAYPVSLLRTFSVLAVLFLIGCAGLILSPMRTWRIGSQSPHHLFPVWLWLLVIFFIEVGITALFLGQDYFVVTNINDCSGAVTMVSMLQSMQFMSQNWSFFPWSLLAFVGVMFAHVSYSQTSHSPFSAFFCMRRKGFLFNIMRRAMDLYVQVGTHIFILLNIVCLGWMYVYFAHNSARVFHPLNGVFAASMLLILRKKDWFLGKRSSLLPKQYSHQGIQLIRMFFLVMLIGLVALFVDRLMFRTSPTLLSAEASATIIGITQPALLLSLWHWAWWLIGTPLLASILVRVSHGRMVWQFVIGVLWLPIVMFIVRLYFGGADIPSDLFYMFPIIGSIFLCALLLYPRANEYLWFGFLPMRSLKKPRMADMQRLWFLAAALLGLLCVAGIAVVQFMLLIIALPSMLIFAGFYVRLGAWK